MASDKRRIWRRGRLFIGGEWRDPASGATFASIAPAREEPVAEVARAGAEDVDRAVRAADRAMRGPWRDVAPAGRGALLQRLAQLIGEAREELAALETSNMGKPIGQARGDVDGAVATLVYNAGAADKIEGATIPLGHDVVDFTLMEPQGVTAHIVPWNFPLGMALRSVAPALAAGSVWINGWFMGGVQAPTGGVKDSGFGRERGLPGICNYVRIKNVAIRLQKISPHIQPCRTTHYAQMHSLESRLPAHQIRTT